MNEIPTEAPPLSQLKLVTMTIGAHLRTSINLDVVSRYTVLGGKIKGINYRNVIRGEIKKCPEGEVNQGLLPPSDLESDYYRSRTGSGRFKNQCTFIVDAGDKYINTKVFNNGQMVNVGCRKAEHAAIVANILTEHFIAMEGLVIYEIPDHIVSSNIKKFYKDDFRKKYANLIQLLACDLDVDMDLEPFCEDVSPDDGYRIFQEELQENKTYASDIMYIYTIINIFKSYFPENETTTMIDHYHKPEFQYVLEMIRNYTDREKGEIACVFPSYLNNKTPIAFNNETVNVNLINKSTNCGFFINRSCLIECLKDEEDVVSYTYDKNRYSGIVVSYRTPTKEIKIIIFNSGKINFTASRTHEQVQQGYEFIEDFCRRNFSKLLLTSEYYNRIRECQDSLPSQFYVGLINDEQIYLLKKSSIILNPRNVRLLGKMKLLNKYHETVPKVSEKIRTLDI